MKLIIQIPCLNEEATLPRALGNCRTVSQENVEIVRQIYEAASRRDSATILRLYDPEVEVDVSRTHGAVMEALYAGPGHHGLRAWSREWLWTIRDSKVVRVVWFPGRAEALDAADSPTT